MTHDAVALHCMRLMAISNTLHTWLIKKVMNGAGLPFTQIQVRCCYVSGTGAPILARRSLYSVLTMNSICILGML